MYVKDITKELVNNKVTFIGLIGSLQVKTTKTEKQYVDLVVGDSEQKILCKLWDYVEGYLTVGVGDPVEITGMVDEWDGKLQINTKEITKVKADLASLIPSSKWELKTMEDGLKHFRDKVSSEHLRKLLDMMIFDNESLYKRYTTMPAAKMIHHNFYRGILQHTLEVLKFGYSVCSTKNLSEKQIDRFITMTMLHDWGKIKEYTPFPKLETSVEGAMLGHIFITGHFAKNAIKTIENFPTEDELVIINGILGHHGSLEWGSPVVPKTIEAQILHQADKFSGDIESIQSHTSKESGDEDFTDKLWNMGTEYYKK